MCEWHGGLKTMTRNESEIISFEWDVPVCEFFHNLLLAQHH